MPAAKKNASVILFDVNCTPEFNSAATKCLLNICGQKWFSASKDCTKLILLNTEESNNSLHAVFKKAPHVSEATDVISYDPNLIKSHLQDVDTGKGDWLIGLAIALEALKTNYEDDKGVMNLQLLFISDFSSPPVTFKEKQINFIMSNVDKMNCFLYILGPKVKTPEHMSSLEDIRNWSKNVEFISDDGNVHLPIVKRIVEGTTNSVVCDLELGQELFLNYRNYRTLQPWQVPLTVGTGLVFSSVMIRFLRAVAPPKIKANHDQHTPWSWHLVDDVSAEVAYDNVIGGVFKHGKFIPLPQDVEKNFKCREARSFKIIGFTEQSNISELYMSGDGSACVQSNNSRIFDLLLHMLAKQNMFAVARRIYMQNCKPKLFVLIPRAEQNIFIAAELPYKNNVPIKYAEQDMNEIPSLNDNPAIRSVYDYLDKLDINNPNNHDTNGCVKFPLNGILMNPIRLNLINQRLLQKYLGEEINFEENATLPRILEDEDVAPYLELCPPPVVKEEEKEVKDESF